MTMLAYALYFAALVGAALALVAWMARVYSEIPALGGIERRVLGGAGINPGRDMAPDLAFSTAVSFLANTIWQAYSGETQLSYLAQMAGLTVQNFVSAGTGMAVTIAVIRGS